jgi:hypothetical protein
MKLHRRLAGIVAAAIFLALFVFHLVFVQNETNAAGNLVPDSRTFELSKSNYATAP